MQRLADLGIRLSIDAEKLISENKSDGLIEKLLNLKKPFISATDVKELLKDQKKELKVEIRRSSDFMPIAKEYEADLKIIHTKDVTGKSRTKGEVENFVNYFRNRYQRVSRLFRSPSTDPLINLKDVKKYIGENVRVNALVSSKRDTKKGNLLLEIEDLSGTFKAVVSGSRDEKLADKSKKILTDDIIALNGKILEPYMIVNDIEWPDFPVMRQRKTTENDLGIAYISDTHFGSSYFLEKEMKHFLDWLHGKGEAKDLAGKVKYLLVAGDLVDGIGIYPNQEKELLVKDIYAQYKMFDDFANASIE
jgi:DNA polymerase II small subunit